MTTFQIVSDLHIDYNNNEVPNPLSFITPSADILILAGDIGSLYKIIQLTEFLIKLCKYFQIVIYIPGNHEYYTQKNIPHRPMNFLFKRLKNIEHTIKNLYILNKSTIEINNIYIVGCTLWSNPSIPIPRFIVRIKEMNTKYYTQKFNEELSYITDMIEHSKQNKKKLLVVTHYMPTYSIFQNIHTKNKYISLYTTNLDYLLTKENIHTWIAGHIHINVDTITTGGTHLIGNQFGKPKDNIKDYDMKKIIIIN